MIPMRQCGHWRREVIAEQIDPLRHRKTARREHVDTMPREEFYEFRLVGDVPVKRIDERDIEDTIGARARVDGLPDSGSGISKAERHFISGDAVDEF